MKVCARAHYPAEENVDDGLKTGVTTVSSVIVFRRTGNPVEWQEGRDIWWHDAVSGVSADCPPQEMNAEDPLFILYTSGSTGKPKGVLHTTGGYGLCHTDI